MNYKKYLLLLVACIATTQADLNHTAIARKAAEIKAVQARRDFVYNTGIKLTGAIVVGYLGYQVYRWTLPVSYDLSIFGEDVQKNKDLFKQVCDSYADSKLSWWNSTPAWLAKSAAGLVGQSVVSQTLQPLYNYVRAYTMAEVPVAVKRSWFLSEQFLVLDNADKKIEINKEFLDFINHIDAVELAYADHQEVMLQDAAEYIIAHITHVRENMPNYVYHSYKAEKTSKKLTELLDKMLQDCQAQQYNEADILNFKNLLRELRDLPAYSVN